MKIWAKLAFSNFHTMGHKAGDDLLMLFAVIITEAFKNKGIVFRIGGDEFAVLIFNAIIEDIKNSEKYMYDCIKENNKNLNRGYKLNVSIGYAISSKNDKEILEVFKEADYNMYREKLNSINSTKNSMIQGLMQLLKARDFITEGHGERMKELSGKMGGSIGLPENVIIDLGLLAQFHDIGKVSIPDRILFKTGKLTEKEKIEMQKHSEIGYRISNSIPELCPIADLILKQY